MRLLLFADIHIGSIKDNNYIYNVITEIIDKEIMFIKTDAVIILGDYFDRLFKVNEEYVSTSINVMSYLIRACAKTNTKIRIIYGTESHEMNQYRLFNYHLTSSNVDIKLFTTAQEEELFPNINVLYLPEEYINDKHQFYKDTLYSGKQYQYIFGHGIIEDGMPSIVSFSHNSNKNNEKQVPRFKSGEFTNISNITVFGHYHVHTQMNNVYYLGSLFRDSFGEETPKGYGIIEDNKFKFIENTRAYIYKSYEFAINSDVYQNTDNLIKEINIIKEENADIFSGERQGKIRLIFHTPSNIDSSFRDNLKSIIFNDKHISPLIKESNEDLINDIKEDIDDEYDFILDASMPITDKIYQFISKQYDDHMSLEELNNYINKELIL